MNKYYCNFHCYEYYYFYIIIVNSGRLKIVSIKLKYSHEMLRDRKNEERMRSEESQLFFI